MFVLLSFRVCGQAVLARFGSWNAPELTRSLSTEPSNCVLRRGKDQSFHFSLRDAEEGRWRECHPLVDDGDGDWEANCFQDPRSSMPS